MKKRILFLAILFVLCLATVFPKTVLAVDAKKTTGTTGTGYSTFFDTAAATIQDGVDFYTMREMSMKMYEALIYDPRAFVAELAFREAWLQQAIADGMAETLPDNYLDTAAGIIGMLIYNATSWESQRYGLPVLYNDPSISEKNLLDFFSCRFYVTQNSRPQEYRDDYYALFQEGYTAVHTESHSFHLWKSLKEKPLAFLRALLQQNEQTQTMVINNILFYRTNPQGVVLINVLEETQTCENLSEAEKDLITTLIEGLADAKVYVTATGPDPQELADRQAAESNSATQPEQARPPETQPTTTAPTVESETSVYEPAENKDSKDNPASGILIILAISGGILLGRFIPRRKS